MADTEIARVLERLQFTAALPEATRARLAEQASLRDVPAGAVVFHEGSVHHDLYFVCSGGVALDMHIPGRGKVRILSVGPGELLGWSALLGEGKMTASATAIEDTRLVAVSGPQLLSLCDADHDIGYRVMQRTAKAISKRLLATRLQLLDLFKDLAAPADPPPHEESMDSEN